MKTCTKQTKLFWKYTCISNLSTKTIKCYLCILCKSNACVQKHFSYVDILLFCLLTGDNLKTFSHSYEYFMLYSDWLLHTFVKEIPPILLLMHLHAFINSRLFGQHECIFIYPKNKQFYHLILVNEYSLKQDFQWVFDDVQFLIVIKFTFIIKLQEY